MDWFIDLLCTTLSYNQYLCNKSWQHGHQHHMYFIILHSSETVRISRLLRSHCCVWILRAASLLMLLQVADIRSRPPDTCLSIWPRGGGGGEEGEEGVDILIFHNLAQPTSPSPLHLLAHNQFFLLCQQPASSRRVRRERALDPSANSPEPDHTFNVKCRWGADYLLLKWAATRRGPPESPATLKTHPRQAEFFSTFHLSSRWRALYGSFSSPQMRCII